MRSDSTLIAEKMGRPSSYLVSLAVVPAILSSALGAPHGQHVQGQSHVTSAATSEGAEIERRVTVALAALRPTEADLRELQQLYFEPAVKSVRRHRMRATSSRPSLSMVEDERELLQMLAAHDF